MSEKTEFLVYDDATGEPVPEMRKMFLSALLPVGSVIKVYNKKDYENTEYGIIQYSLRCVSSSGWIDDIEYIMWVQKKVKSIT